MVGINPRKLVSMSCDVVWAADYSSFGKADKNLDALGVADGHSIHNQIKTKKGEKLWLNLGI